MYLVFLQVLPICGYNFNHTILPDKINFKLTTINGEDDQVRNWESV